MNSWQRKIVSDCIAVLIVGVSVIAFVIANQPGFTLSDKMESLRRGCPESRVDHTSLEPCFMVVPEGEALYLETEGAASISGEHRVYSLVSRNLEEPNYVLIEGPIALEIGVVDGSWVVAPETWFDCLPEGVVELKDGVVYCHSSAKT